MANTNITIYEVAAKSGVSLATVSRVLNTPLKVKEETRKKVLKAIEELGYFPNAVARGLASKKSTCVAVLVNDITRQSTSNLLAGIIDIAKSYKYTIKIFQIDSEKDINNQLKLIISDQIDGVLNLNDQLSEDALLTIKKVLDKNLIPFVLCNVVSSQNDIPMVSIDYEKASYELTKKIIEKNCKDVYFISTEKKYSVNEMKEKGYIKAINEYKLNSNIIRTTGNILVNKEFFNDFFRKKNKIDASIIVRDSIAISFMNSCLENGFNIPNDIQVVSFDNTKYCLLSRPELTSINTPIYDIGAVSMRLLTKLMNKEKLEKIKIELPHTIIERGSIK